MFMEIIHQEKLTLREQYNSQTQEAIWFSNFNLSFTNKFYIHEKEKHLKIELIICEAFY